MDILPDVVLRLTSQYLSAQDLAAWSATSRNLREGLNDNVLWRPHCDPLLAEYLRNTECQVEPFFQSPEIEGSGLSPICEWRLCFMRQVHLWNNWRNNRYFSQFLPARYAFSSEFKIGECALFYKNDYLVTHSENTIEVWNMKESPVPVCMEPLLSTGDVTLIQMFRDKIVVKQNHLIQVFQLSIASRKIDFLHSFIFFGTEKSTLKIYDEQARLSDPILGPLIDQVKLVDNILVGMHTDVDRETLHVWNIETGVKMKEEVRPETMFLNFSRHPSSKEPYFIVTAKVEHRAFVKIIYRLEDFVPIFTSPEYYRLPTDAIVIQDYVLIHSYNLTDVYRLRTAEHIRRIDFDEIIIQTDPEQVGNDIIFHFGASRLMRFNPATEAVEEIIHLREEESISPMNYLNEKYWIAFVRNVPMPHLLEVINRNQTSLVQGLRFMEEGEYPQCPYPVIRCINQTCTKLILNSFLETNQNRLTFRDHYFKRMKVVWFW